MFDIVSFTWSTLKSIQLYLPLYIILRDSNHYNFVTARDALGDRHFFTILRMMCKEFLVFVILVLVLKNFHYFEKL